MTKLRPIDSFRKDLRGGIVIEMNIKPPVIEHFTCISECIKWLDGAISTLTNPSTRPIGHMITMEDRTKLAERYKDLKRRMEAAKNEDTY